MNEQSLFTAAIAHSAAERSAFLREACGDDEVLRQRIEKLVEVHAAAGDFLERPAPGSGATIEQQSFEKPGAQIGPYKLLQQIGEGGMGTVFMAEQTQPVQRRVALKIIKPGMDSRQVIARFAAEKQALAMMDHVNIARVLDAGTTEQGRPYFVMELVNGVPITKYCDDNHLTPRQRLELFVPVCQASQHAHQKGIIHRDIKPSNVMITLYDGKPVPKVIDFGVAKAMEQKLTEQTLFTQYGTLVGTLEYMSPEQAEMSALGVDTRSDIYSLGVLLYELLTGSTPLSRKQMKEAAYGEILRLIKEEEPPKPSTRLSESGESLASISALRQTEPAKLSKLMRGELDWIVMKTLEKDRNRRYETASGFAADLQRYLNDETVQACPPSAAYRFRKFARRNKVAISTTMLVAVALVLGTLVATWQAIRATRAEGIAQERLEGEKTARLDADSARQQAEKDRDRARVAEKLAEANFQKALDAVDQMLTEVGQESLASIPQMEPVRRALLEKALTFYQDFLKQKSADSSLRYETARAYQRMDAIYSLLGQYRESVAASRQAIAILEQLEAEFPTHRDYRYQLGQSYKSLGYRLRLQDEPAEAAYRQAIARHEKLASEFPGEPVYQEALAHDYNSFAYFLGRNRVQDAEPMYGKAVVLLQDLTARFPDVDGYRVTLAEVSRALGVLLWRMRRFEEAERPLRQAIALLEAMNANSLNAVRHQQTLARSRFHLGRVLESSGRAEEAEEVYQAAKAVQEKLLVDFPNTREYQWELAESLDSLAMLRLARGRAEEAGELWERVRRVYPPYSALPNNRAWTLATSPDPKMRNPALAVELARQVDRDVPNNNVYLNTLGVAEYRAGNWKESVAALQKSIDLFKGELEAFNTFFLAMAHWQLGERDEARKSFDRAVEWMDKQSPENEELRRFRIEAEELLEIKAKM